MAVALPVLGAAGPVAAQTPGSQSAAAARTTSTDPNALVRPPTLDRPPAGRVRSANQVLRIAGAIPKVRTAIREHSGATREAFLKGPGRWQVSYYAQPDLHKRPREITGDEIAQVSIDDATGRVREAWTGFQVAWTMARGYPGAFGRRSAALYVWLPLCLLFIAPFVDWRRPLRLLHLDLLMLVGFSASLAFFSHGRIDVSVPLAYPFLLYLLVRMAFAARRRRKPAEALHLLVPVRWLAIALVFLVAFRVGLNVTNSNVIDVGYAGVIGADRLADGNRLYGEFPQNNQHGDTYGPVNYYAYVPFEQALPWSGAWDDLPAAHAASIVFDLLTIAGLMLLGRRIRGPTLGVILAYAWAAYPFTLFVMNSNANDSLVALLVVASLLVIASPTRRGAAAALAGLTKFAPLALAPLLATYRGGATPERGSPGVGRSWLGAVVPFVLVFTVVGAAALAPVLLHGGLHRFTDRTLGFQNDRGSPFSVWGYYGGLGSWQDAVKIAAAALAVLVAFVPRRRDIVCVAALGAMVLIALQIGVTHWFYLYIVWFLPLVLVALFGRYRDPAATQACA